MAWIETVHPDKATGLCKRLYAAAIKRAGKVFNVIRIQSPQPRILQCSTRLYLEVMHGEGGITRRQREMIATVVSQTNGCRY